MIKHKWFKLFAPPTIYTLTAFLIWTNLTATPNLITFIAVGILINVAVDTIREINND